MEHEAWKAEFHQLWTSPATPHSLMPPFGDMCSEFILFLKLQIFLSDPLKTYSNGHFYPNEKTVEETPTST